MTRLQAEADALGAHGVVGVDLRFEYLVGAPGTATFLATGTAVVHPGMPPLPAAVHHQCLGPAFREARGPGFHPGRFGRRRRHRLRAAQLRSARGNFDAPSAPTRSCPRRWPRRGLGPASRWPSQAHRNGEGVVHT